MRRVWLLLAVLVAVSARGQGAPVAAPATPPEPAGQPAAPAVPPPPPAAFSDRRADVPDAEKLTRSSKALVQMREALRDLVAKLQEARENKDVVKLNCVNEKLTQVKGLLRLTEQADVALQEAIARQDRRAADHEFLKITIAEQKVGQLKAEAQECIGQLAFRTDEKQEVTVEEPVGLPDDPTSPPTPRFPVPSSPPASPPL